MNSFGKLFKVSIYGESHGPSVGVLISGIKPGIKVDYDLINEFLEKRKPNYAGSTPRKEDDDFIIESGINDGFTTGTPILIRVLNKNVKAKDYDDFKDIYRPSHTDFVAKEKYGGYNSLSGSGHFSGRVTTGLVIAGAFAKMYTNYEIKSELKQVGRITDMTKLDDYINEIQKQKDSVGAIVQLTVPNVEIGLGEPFFRSADAVIAQIIQSIPAVKGVSFGDGFDGVFKLGSEFNDPYVNDQGKTSSNNAGGINGGITNGNDIVVNVFVKPASSISLPQETFNFKTKEMDVLKVKGRHDSFIAKRAMIVLESAIHIALCDLLMEKRSRS